MAAMVMAMNHFNNRDGSIVSELESLGDCPVYFPLNASTVADSALKYQHSVKALLDHTDTKQEDIPCALIGPANMDAVKVVATLASTLHLPLVAYEAMDKVITEP